MSNLISKDWFEDVYDCVKKIDKDIFTLEDIYEYEELLSSLHPNNNNVQAKIRQQLQYLRDIGKLEFIDNNGTYKKCEC